MKKKLYLLFIIFFGMSIYTIANAASCSTTCPGADSISVDNCSSCYARSATSVTCYDEWMDITEEKICGIVAQE